MSPENPNNHYNLAGVYALMNRLAEAFEALERDFELGDHDYLYLEADDSFEGMREGPRFDDLIARMKRAGS